jgi:hypothetical protein
MSFCWRKPLWYCIYQPPHSFNDQGMCWCNPRHSRKYTMLTSVTIASKTYNVLLTKLSQKHLLYLGICLKWLSDID